MSTDDCFNRPSWGSASKERMNRQTMEWYSEIEPYMEENGYVLSSCGMLMGMFNAASTTLGCGAVMHRMDPKRIKVVTLRSSDDSMTIYVAKDPMSLMVVVPSTLLYLKIV